MELGCDVASNDIFDAYACGLEFSGLRYRSVSSDFALRRVMAGSHFENIKGADERGWMLGRTSRSCAISRRCCFAFAESFCCTMRSLDIESLSWTLSLF